MDFDEILDEIGDYGRFQKVKMFLLCIPLLFSGANSFSNIFIAGEQNYRYKDEFS